MSHHSRICCSRPQLPPTGTALLLANSILACWLCLNRLTAGFISFKLPPFKAPRRNSEGSCKEHAIQWVCLGWSSVPFTVRVTWEWHCLTLTLFPHLKKKKSNNTCLTGWICRIKELALRLLRTLSDTQKHSWSVCFLLGSSPLWVSCALTVPLLITQAHWISDCLFTRLNSPHYLPHTI